MAKTKRSTPQHNPFITRLVAIGCTYCATCRAFMWPEHIQHVTADQLAVDWSVSRLQVVGGYGNVRVVDMSADVEQAA